MLKIRFPRCYNFDEIVHLSKYFPHHRILWSSHYRVTIHDTKDCSKFITKWEMRNIQRTVNIVSLEPRTMGEEDRITINFVIG